MVCCVIPTYKARATVCDVVRKALRYVDAVIVVDDACPQGSAEAVVDAFRGHPSVHVIRRAKNGGVGAATKAVTMQYAAMLADGPRIAAPLRPRSTFR